MYHLLEDASKSSEKKQSADSFEKEKKQAISVKTNRKETKAVSRRQLLGSVVSRSIE